MVPLHLGLMNLGGAILPSTLLGILPVGVLLYCSGALTPAQLTLILSMSIIGPVSWFTNAVNEYKSIQYAVRDIEEILEISELPERTESAKLNGSEMRLNGMRFAYNEQDGGVDIREIPLKQLSENISYVAQDNFLFNCSLSETILMGNPTASDEEVMAAAEAAQCGEFISRLEQGWDTPAGVKLSGGERQRIAIARAILKNAPVVILDEATVFTDPENEAQLQCSIARLTRGNTLLVIAHKAVHDKGRGSNPIGKSFVRFERKNLSGYLTMSRNAFCTASSDASELCSLE